MDQNQPKLKNDSKNKVPEIEGEAFHAQLKLKEGIKKKELESELKKATSLSEKEISDVADVILDKLEEVQKDIVDNNLENLSKTVTDNTQKVDMELRDNNWVLIWAMNVNKTTNNINITINQPKVEAPKTKPSTNNQPKVETPKTKPSTNNQPKVETPKIEPQFVEKSVQNNIDIHTLDWFLLMADKLLQEIKETKDWISKKWLSKAWKKTMDDVKKKLEQYEKQLNGKIKGLKNSLKQQNRVEISDNDIAHLRYLFQQVGNAREDIWLWQWWEYSNIASFLYNSPENVREANKRQANSLEFNQKLQEEVKKSAILNIFNWKTQIATDFYRRIAQWDYTQADYQLFTTNAAVLTPSFQNCGIPIPVWPRSVQTNLWGFEYTSWSSRWSVDYSNMDFWEAFQVGGLAWLVDKGLSSCKNMTPWQRNAWKSIAVLWGFAAWIFWLYKFYTNEKMWFWGKAWITAAAILWTQMLTWEWPISLYSKLMTWWFTKEWRESKFWSGVFWDAVSWVWKSWIDASQTVVPSMYSMMIFNDKTTVWDIRNLTAKFKTDGNAWMAFRQDAINKLKNGGYGDACVERFSAKFSNNFDEQKWDERLTSMWITDSTDDEKTVYELANNSTLNEVVLTKFKSDNWLKETDNSIKKQELHDYIDGLKQRNQAIDINVLNGHKNDWFKPDGKLSYTERDEDKQNKEKLVNQVDSLSIDSRTKEQLKQAIQTFYDERTLETKPNLNDFSLRMENDFLVVKSHNWEETKINIKNNSIKGFWSENKNGYEIPFYNLSDLFNVADLTNDILCQKKKQTIVDFPPFQYKMLRKWICFNDAETVSFNMDTRVLSTGWWWATSKIEILYEHPDKYAQYLSDRWIEDNKINIDAVSYPLTKILSDSWIVFFVEQEVKELEIWLEWVRKKLQYYKWHRDWPFSISIRNKLEFKTMNWDIIDFSEDILDKFPTLKLPGHEEQFLKAMNNASNKMRWSAL